MKVKIAWLLCVLWMGFIFFMSAMPGDISSEQSGVIVTVIKEIIETVTRGRAVKIDTDAVQFFVRKAAHMLEYAVLFLLYRRALALSGARHPGIAALLLCSAYASTDEFHQRFVDDRGASPVDVLIDTAGAALAWLLTMIKEQIAQRVRT